MNGNWIIWLSQVALHIISEVGVQHISDRDSRQDAVLNDVLSKTI